MALLQRDKPCKSGTVQRVIVLSPGLLQALDWDGFAKVVPENSMQDLVDLALSVCALAVDDQTELLFCLQGKGIPQILLEEGNNLGLISVRPEREESLEEVYSRCQVSLWIKVLLADMGDVVISPWPPCELTSPEIQQPAWAAEQVWLLLAGEGDYDPCRKDLENFSLVPGVLTVPVQGHFHFASFGCTLGSCAGCITACPLASHLAD